MEAGGRRLVAVGLAMVGLALSGEAGEPTENGSNVCQFSPSVSAAVTMECDYRGIREDNVTVFPIGQLPSSIQVIRISNVGGRFIMEDELSNLTSLHTIHLSKMNSLQIAKTDWTQNKQLEQVTITIDSIRALRLDSGAFSGWASPGPRIIISNVTGGAISESAFNDDSVIRSVTLQNITTMKLESGAFLADIGQLQLHNVSDLGDCPQSSFGGRISNISLNSVKIGEIHSGCLQATDGWDSLIIQSCHFERIQPHGIEGSIHEVVTEDSYIGRVEQRGLRLNTSTFTMASTEVGEFAQDALDIQFNQSASLQSSTINSLRANAFQRLMSRAGEEATLTIQAVSVNETENGSLAFSEHTPVTLLDVALRDACECDVDQRALQLVVGDEPPHNTTDQQLSIVQQIIDRVSCTTETVTPTLGEFHCQHCPSGVNDTIQCPLTTPMAPWEVIPVWGWCMCGVCGVMVPLMVAGFVRRLSKRPRYSLHKDEKPRSVSQDIYHKELNATPEPNFSEFPMNFTPNGQKTTAVAVLTLASDDEYLHDSQQQPEYAQIDVVVQLSRNCSAEHVEISSPFEDLQVRPVHSNSDGKRWEEPLYQK